MDPVILAILLVVVLFAALLWNKIPTPITMMVIPFVFALIAGYTLLETATAVANQFNSLMTSVGYMILFSLIYFQVVTDCGMFDTIIDKLLDIVGTKINVPVILILTAVISLIVSLTTNITAAYLVTVPIVLTLFKRFQMDRMAAIIICGTSLVIFSFLPWSFGLAMASQMIGAEINDLSAAAMPWAMCFIPVLILEIVYFTLAHKKAHGTLALPSGAVEEAEEHQKKENPLARPKLFWFNLLLFIAVVLCLTLSGLPAWFVFAAAAFLGTIVNYLKDSGKVWNKAAAPILNILLMLLAVSAYIAVFSYAPEGGTSLLNALSTWLVGSVPEFLLRYSGVIFIILAVIIVRLVPYQMYMAMFPMIASVGLAFDISAVAMIAPLAVVMVMGSAVSPMTATTYVSTAVAEVDIMELGKRGVIYMEVGVIVALIFGAVFGLLPV